MSSLRLRFLPCATSLVLLLALTLAPPTAHADVIVSPSQSFQGQPQSQLANGFWRWALSFPSATNPLVDTTGAYSYLGNQGSFFYLGGTIGNASATRTVTVNSGQSLFVPIFPFITWADISAYGGGYANLQRDDAETAGIEPNGSAPNTTLFLTLDGKPAPLPSGTTSLFDFRQVSPTLFGLNIPADNVFGLTGPPYPGTVQALADGWYALLNPLSPGIHTLEFGGETTGIGAYAEQTISTDTTFIIDVIPVSTPAPSTVALFALGGIGLAGWRRWRKRATE